MHAFKCSILIVGASAWIVNPVRAHQLNPSQADSYEVLQDSRGIVRLGEILVDVANESDYRALKFVLKPDEWDVEEQRRFLVDHAYYTLFSRDPDSLPDLGPMHRGVSNKRIDATILVFKSADLAAREVARLKAKNLDNIGAIVKRSDSNGFHIGMIGRTYCAVRHETIVVLLETRDQEETLMVIADKLARAKW